jgi:hypothetical protein
MTVLERYLLLTAAIETLAQHVVEATDTKLRFLLQQEIRTATDLGSVLLDYFSGLPDGSRPPQTTLDQVSNAMTELDDSLIILGGTP